MIGIAVSNILGQPLQLLSGVDKLGIASSAHGHMSKGVATLSMDKITIQIRHRQIAAAITSEEQLLHLGCLVLLLAIICFDLAMTTKQRER